MDNDIQHKAVMPIETNYNFRFPAHLINYMQIILAKIPTSPMLTVAQLASIGTL